MRSAYENSYAIINEKRNKDSESVFEEDLNKYIPHYSYYCGIPSMPESDEFDREIVRKNTSFYVWVENEAGYKQFQEYLDELCDKMQESYERNINIGNYIKETDYILRCILELAKCIQVLHRFALYHLDLNPYNFGVQLYSNKVDKDNAVINLYVIDDIKKSLEIKLRLFGENSFYVAVAYDNIARFSKAYEIAQPTFVKLSSGVYDYALRAIEIAKRIFSENGKTTARSYMTLAWCMDADKMYDKKFVGYIKKAVEISPVTYKKDAAKLYNNAIEYYKNISDLEEAIIFIEEAEKLQ